MATRTSQVDTIKLLTALGRALGSNVEVRSRPGRPPRPTSIEDVLTPQPRRRHRKLKPNPTSLRRQLAAATTETEAKAVLATIKALPNGKLPKWDAATVYRYLPAHLKHLSSK